MEQTQTVTRRRSSDAGAAPAADLPSAAGPTPAAGPPPAAGPTPTVQTPGAPASSDVAPGPQGVVIDAADLAALLGAAATIDLGDAEAGARLRHEARLLTARLATSARIPGHLVVGPGDPTVVVVRTLAAAARRVTPTCPAPAIR